MPRVETHVSKNRKNYHDLAMPRFETQGSENKIYHDLQISLDNSGSQPMRLPDSFLISSVLKPYILRI